MLKQYCAALLLVLLSVSGCKQQPASNDHLEGLYRAGRELDAAMAVGVSYAAFGDLLQKLAAEVLIAKDHATTDEEKKIIAAYADLLSTYKDSATVWKQQIESSKYDWLKGAIYVEPELQPIVTKYEIPTESHTMQYSGHAYSTIPKDSIQRVWTTAGEKSSAALELYLRQPNLRQPN